MCAAPAQIQSLLPGFFFKAFLPPPFPPSLCSPRAELHPTAERGRRSCSKGQGMLHVHIRAGGSFEIPQGKAAGLERGAPAEPLPLKIGLEILPALMKNAFPCL